MYIEDTIPKDQQIIEQLNEFRQNPQTAVPILQQRINHYRTRKGKTSIVSFDGSRKIPIKEEQSPQERIHQLISIVENQCNPMPALRRTQKLSEVAEKIFQALELEEFKQVNLTSSEKKELRGILKEDERFEYSNDITCMISTCFDEPYEVLCSILVDDDIPSRTNREVLLDPTITHMGICSRNIQNKEHLRCTVILCTSEVMEQREQPVVVILPVENPKPSKIKVFVESDVEEISQAHTPVRFNRSDWFLRAEGSQIKQDLMNESERVELEQDNQVPQGYNFNDFRNTFIRGSGVSSDHKAGRLFYGSGDPMEEYSIEIEENIKLTDKTEHLTQQNQLQI